jgi:hypothetical protein
MYVICIKSQLIRVVQTNMHLDVIWVKLELYHLSSLVAFEVLMFQNVDVFFIKITICSQKGKRSLDRISLDRN